MSHDQDPQSKNEAAARKAATVIREANLRAILANACNLIAATGAREPIIGFAAATIDANGKAGYTYGGTVACPHMMLSLAELSSRVAGHVREEDGPQSEKTEQGDAAVVYRDTGDGDVLSVGYDNTLRAKHEADRAKHWNAFRWLHTMAKVADEFYGECLPSSVRDDLRCFVMLGETGMAEYDEATFYKETVTLKERAKDAHA
jgi:hypothetical protein